MPQNCKACGTLACVTFFAGGFGRGFVLAQSLGAGRDTCAPRDSLSSWEPPASCPYSRFAVTWHTIFFSSENYGCHDCPLTRLPASIHGRSAPAHNASPPSWKASGSCQATLTATARDAHRPSRFSDRAKGRGGAESLASKRGRMASAMEQRLSISRAPSSSAACPRFRRRQ